MKKKDAINFILSVLNTHDISLKELLQGYIEKNSIIGVGLITLEEDLVRMAKELRKENANKG